jgi:MFS family permease
MPPAFFRPILTRQTRVPWTWVFFMNLPWAAALYQEFVSQTAMTFTLRRFVEDPRLIAFLGSVNIAFNFLVGAVANYLSDRIWTRWGRRRPFLIVGGLGAAVMLFILPLLPTFPLLVAGIVLYQFFVDVATPLEPLVMEVVPPPQRGRAQALRMVLQGLSVFYFYNVMFAHFDEVHEAPAWLASLGVATLTGEILTYWAGGVLGLGVVAIWIVLVRETPVAPVAGPAFTPLGFLRDVFADRRSWFIYLLFVAPTFVHAVWGQFQPLLMTEQFGYSKGVMAAMALPGTILSLAFFTPVLGWLADRKAALPSWMALTVLLVAGLLTQRLAGGLGGGFTEAPGFVDMVLLGLATCAAALGGVSLVQRPLVWLLGAGSRRIALYLTGIGGVALLAAVQWFVVRAYAPAAPPLGLLYVLGQLGGVLAGCGWVVMGPMLFDYIPANRFGTVSSGMGFANGFVRFLVMNAAGFWVVAYSTWFPREGGPDYASCFALQAVLGLPAVVAILLFAREARQGRMEVQPG